MPSSEGMKRDELEQFLRDNEPVGYASNVRMLNELAGVIAGGGPISSVYEDVQPAVSEYSKMERAIKAGRSALEKVGESVSMVKANKLVQKGIDAVPIDQWISSLKDRVAESKKVGDRLLKEAGYSEGEVYGFPPSTVTKKAAMPFSPPEHGTTARTIWDTFEETRETSSKYLRNQGYTNESIETSFGLEKRDSVE